MSELFSKYKKLPREIYVLFFARFVNSLGAFVFPLLTLILTEKIGLNEFEAGQRMLMLTVVQGIAMVAGGKIADRIGRRKLIVYCQFAGACLYIACGFIPPSETMIQLIILTSGLYSATFPAYEALTTDVTDASNRKGAFGILYMGFNLGYAFGPTIAGFLFKNNLPLVFIGDGATTILSTLLIVLFIKETLPDKHGSPNEGSEKYTEGSVFKVLWERKKLIAFALVMFLFEFAYMQWAFELPLQTSASFPDGANVLGVRLLDGAAIYGTLGSFNGILVIALTPFITFLIRKWNALRGMAVAGVLFAASFAMLIFFKNIEAFYIMVFIMTVGEIFSTIDSKTYLADNSPSSHRGRLNSAISFVSGASRLLSPVVVGWLIANRGMDSGWLVISSAAFLGAVSVFALSTREKCKIRIDECVPENQENA